MSNSLRRCPGERDHLQSAGLSRTNPSDLMTRSGNWLLRIILRPIVNPALATFLSSTYALTGGNATTSRFAGNRRRTASIGATRSLSAVTKTAGSKRFSKAPVNISVARFTSVIFSSGLSQVVRGPETKPEPDCRCSQVCGAANWKVFVLRVCCSWLRSCVAVDGVGLWIVF